MFELLSNILSIYIYSFYKTKLHLFLLNKCGETHMIMTPLNVNPGRGLADPQAHMHSRLNGRIY